MSSIALQSQARSIAIPSFWRSYNKYALLSVLMATLFVSYFFLQPIDALAPIFNYSIVFIVFVPIAAFVLSVISLKQIAHTHDKGATLGYAALGITSLYFMVSLAIPLVLLGMYLMYTYMF